jgi:ATP-dependent phosphofructokinase / diphosphate-dependent phosphofructokinase
MTERNLLVVQGGGPTPVLNATLAAIVEEALKQEGFSHIYGARRGIHGVLQGKTIDLNRLSLTDINLLRITPGAALGSSRAKLSNDDLVQLLDYLRRNNVRDLLFLGGNGTMRGAETVSRYCAAHDFDVRVLGVPKTIDNDIAITDRCPGYASAARYIAQSTRDLGLDVRSLPQPVSILETMGRGVGWLGAAAAAGKLDEQDAPHLVYLPEQAFEMDAFLAQLDRLIARQGWAVVVVAEGIRDAAGRFIYQVEDPTQNDPLKRPITGGVAQFIAEAVARNLKVRCRSEKPGLLGRASFLHASEQDKRDADIVGRTAVLGLLRGETEKMVSLRSLIVPNEPQCELVSLERVAEVERPIPVEWMEDGPIPVKNAFFEYLQPLIGDLVSYSTVFHQ